MRRSLILFVAVLSASPLRGQAFEGDPHDALHFGASETPVQSAVKEYLRTIEGYVGRYLPSIRENLGQPDRIGVEQEGINEREAVLWYYDIPLDDLSTVTWRVASQFDRVVGVQVSTNRKSTSVHAAAREIMQEDGRTLFTREENQHMSRRGDLIWQINLVDAADGNTAIVEIGTVKYSSCPMIWSVEKLAGTDGFGGALPG